MIRAALVAVLFLFSPGGGYGKQVNEAVSHGVNQFSHNFLNQLNTQQENIVYSPLSIVLALGMLLKGARGSTAQEILTVLNANHPATAEDIHKKLNQILVREESQKRNNLTLNFGNLAVLSDTFPFEKSYSEFLRSNYHALFKSANFKSGGQEALSMINQYVNKKTNGLIKKLFENPLDRLTKLVLVNTLYFKGIFLKPFSTYLTYKQTFYNYDKSESQVDMMHQEEEFNSAYDGKATTLELAYHGNVSMYVIVPEERYGLQSVLQNFSHQKLEKTIGLLKRKQCMVQFPKFSYDHKPNLKQVLVNLGVQKVFDKYNAELQGISTAHQLYVSQAVHKANINVNEGGTEAAATSGIVVAVPEAVMIPPPRVIEVDHPFAFVIRDKTHKVNLFIGVVNSL